MPAQDIKPQTPNADVDAEFTSLMKIAKAFGIKFTPAELAEIETLKLRTAKPAGKFKSGTAEERAQAAFTFDGIKNDALEKIVLPRFVGGEEGATNAVNGIYQNVLERYLKKDERFQIPARPALPVESPVNELVTLAGKAITGDTDISAVRQTLSQKLDALSGSADYNLVTAETIRQLKDYLQAADRNNDKKLDSTELAALPPLDNATFKAALNKVPNDGAISIENFVGILKAAVPSLEAADNNKDGKVSREEYKEAMVKAADALLPAKPQPKKTTGR